MKRFKVIFQQDRMDCGAACLAMVARHYGCHDNMATIRCYCGNCRNGLSLLSLNEAACKMGFKTRAVTLSFPSIQDGVLLPAIVHWKEKHFVVVYRVSRKRVYVADPTIGRCTYTYSEFQKNWTKGLNGDGFALLLEPETEFSGSRKVKSDTAPFRLKSYIAGYKSSLFCVVGILVLCSLIQLLYPLLTQNIVDVGIRKHRPDILFLILCGQLILTVSEAVFSFIHSKISLVVGVKLNIRMSRDYLIKLSRLPMRFFDIRQSGDLLNRIVDTSRIENFVAYTAPEMVIAVFSFIVWSCLLLYYDARILLIFLIGCVIYSIWMCLFLRKRRQIDYERFSLISDNQEEMIQYVRGMQEIKLCNCASVRIKLWDAIQRSLLNVNERNLSLSQAQSIGGIVIHQVSDLVIVYLTANCVLAGEMSLGAMFAIHTIIGSLKVPVTNFVDFVRNVQDMYISSSRLQYVFSSKEEQELQTGTVKLAPIPHEISLTGVSFSYEPSSANVLAGISVCIPAGRMTAIVGKSGCGKTTFLKLLLGCYSLKDGDICIDGVNINDLDVSLWRDECGIVMQDGYIFSDTIERNIAPNDDAPNMERVRQACEVACLLDFVNSLPLAYKTKVGTDGINLSSGQKQRILIARAVYKNPSTMIMDEATNSLDATNEHCIYDNLNKFLHGRTSIIVAHRLSTIKNADNILVMDGGNIVESGSHWELLHKRGKYYELVSNQLE